MSACIIHLKLFNSTADDTPMRIVDLLGLYYDRTRGKEDFVSVFLLKVIYFSPTVINLSLEQISKERN